jgi:phenylacetic acid degradation operon negative regulatory protein
MAAPSSQDLVFTLFGDYLLAREKPVWVGSLIVLLGRLGLAEPATRTALSRMTKRGWLVASRRGSRGYYSLTARGRRLLEEGRERIYHPPRHPQWDGSWYLVAYSIPEARRALRDRLRAKLLWLGCGPLTNGLWITPHDPRAEVTEIARQLRVTRHVEVFRAEHLGFSSTTELVAQCWDLPAINRRYRQFRDRWSAQLTHCRQCRQASVDAVGGRACRPCTSPEDCFVRRFELVHEYRAFPAIDPFLPAALLPEDWLGDAAAEVFETYRTVLAEPAEAFVQQVCAAGDDEAALAG